MLKRLGAYLMRCLIALDQAANVIFFCGRVDETMSAHMGRAMLEGRAWGKAFSWVLNTIQPKHVQGAILHDEQRAQTIVDIEKQNVNKR